MKNPSIALQWQVSELAPLLNQVFERQNLLYIQKFWKPKRSGDLKTEWYKMPKIFVYILTVACWWEHRKVETAVNALLVIFALNDVWDVSKVKLIDQKYSQTPSLLQRTCLICHRNLSLKEVHQLDETDNIYTRRYSIEALILCIKANNAACEKVFQSQRRKSPNGLGDNYHMEFFFALDACVWLNSCLAGVLWRESRADGSEFVSNR